jgi:hypothetical protein
MLVLETAVAEDGVGSERRGEWSSVLEKIRGLMFIRWIGNVSILL